MGRTADVVSPDTRSGLSPQWVGSLRRAGEQYPALRQLRIIPFSCARGSRLEVRDERGDERVELRPQRDLGAARERFSHVGLLGQLEITVADLRCQCAIRQCCCPRMKRHDSLAFSRRRSRSGAIRAAGQRTSSSATASSMSEPCSTRSSPTTDLDRPQRSLRPRRPFVRLSEMPMRRGRPQRRSLRSWSAPSGMPSDHSMRRSARRSAGVDRDGAPAHPSAPFYRRRRQQRSLPAPRTASSRDTRSAGRRGLDAGIAASRT
jgi:hypothetical protein